MSLIVNEIFHSIQGESSFSGLPCVFIRLTGCNLRCSYCDTRYAYEMGSEYDVDELLTTVQSYQCPIVEITGGEPLVQDETPDLVDILISRGFSVLMETNGSIDISKVRTECVRIIDMKCPSSGEHSRNDLENLNRLSGKDELKFVIGDRPDYEFARNIVSTLKMDRPSSGKIHFSTVYGKLAPDTLAKWILDDRLNVRMQLQMHKYVWDPDKRGV